MRPILHLCILMLSALPFCHAADLVEEALESNRDWAELEPYQGKITQSTFVTAMDRIYAPNADWRPWMEVDEKGVWIEKGARPGEGRMRLRFAAGDAAQFSYQPRDLKGLRIAIDPGHIGGIWGVVEERSFSIGDGPVVREGDLTLQTAKRLEVALRELGAEVFLTRESAQPVTELRAEDFTVAALLKLGSEEGMDKLANRYFYRTAEIRARSKEIEEWGGADLAVALHINASGFEDPDNPSLHEKNDAHVLIHGCYLDGELADPDQRIEMLLRLLKGYHVVEEKVGAEMVRTMRESTGLPAYDYPRGNAAPLDDEKYLWSRNLLANRLFDCPVVFLEPWQANSVAVYEWAGAGDYEGERSFGGESRISLPAQYADFVIEALTSLYGAAK
ncbi:N-acetylmuramoyl-L-alanine amidase [Pelagicoccus albus]|uniref:N-acetylmuramoyl-L-alanine amidase n=1 Tax=Pelagicoccus albus TaxID=415222 RepID=A0A7X1BAA4_9BACT|nr:N-acetylmuramoyl-L-alanine amidase [Pelagicoccus albus]MBC2607303.1 N-acetylmuramoyl-L-alanine amidase [Pelagicoccus albus]